MHNTIYPEPKSVKYSEGTFSFGRELTLCVSSDFTNNDYISKIKETWNDFCYGGCSLNVETDKDLPPCTFVFADGEIPELRKEDSYSLKVSCGGICVKAKSDKELLYGFYTLLQMIKLSSLDEGKESYYIDCAEIHDAPGIGFRSAIFCVHPYTSLKLLRKQVRLAGLMKFTHIILEFWGSLKFDIMPELAWKEGFTKEQIRPIIDDARAMGMEIIPMFNHLGHASGSEMLACKHVVLDQNPRHACLFENSGWTFCISNPDTRKLLKGIRRELIELCGEGSYFHIGMDEAHDFASCDRCDKYKPEELLAEFVNEIRDEMASEGRRLMMWADMLTPKEEFKEFSPLLERNKTNFLVANSTDECPTHKALDKINKDVILVDWQYYFRPEMSQKLLTSEYLSKWGFDTVSASWKNFEAARYLTHEAAREGRFGYMAAIWQSVAHCPEMLVFAGEAAWLGEKAKELSIDRPALTFYNTANLQRRIMPGCSDYESAGMMGTSDASRMFC